MGISTLRQYHHANDELSRAKRAVEAARAKAEHAASAAEVAQREYRAACDELAAIEVKPTEEAPPVSVKIAPESPKAKKRR